MLKIRPMRQDQDLDGPLWTSCRKELSMMLSRVRAIGPTNIFFSDVRLAGCQPPTGEIHFFYGRRQLTGKPDAERSRCHGLVDKGTNEKRGILSLWSGPYGKNAGSRSTVLGGASDDPL
ncbi:uncharacterized protein BO88DRAFT_249578 [Aspergillus vadensis CBS 113365]|uniref:Uncharacterized protein n=1 Tax=Aspergillus vadensis (strain CBS 113365 / IMI 142717 / IBT 24658) TaxID=1448311 RepID=A0A319CSW2_ASPVC|nr:hypothetical protein BO88DRAFT_249578 [Aspergillus vadensis CBS 113365]PYH71352.1 hypothetical protein BO88DRAFT_249578 [Aspergillus vadensis CBS 113365]